jgi:hypothetical protein
MVVQPLDVAQQVEGSACLALSGRAHQMGPGKPSRGIARTIAWASCDREGKPRAEGSFDAGRSSMRLLEDKHPRRKFALTVGRGQFDIKV